MSAEITISFLNYSLVAVVSYIGLLCGAALAFIAPEELKSGQKHLLLFKRALFVAIFFAFIYFSGTRNVLIPVLLLVLSALLIKYADGYIAYVVLGLLFYLSSKELTFFITIASLIFLHGLPSGTLFIFKQMQSKKIKHEKLKLNSTGSVMIRNLLIHYLLFLVISLPLYFSHL